MKKRCSKCKTFKSSDRFYKNKHTSDGLASWCRECQNVQSSIRPPRITTITQSVSIVKDSPKSIEPTEVQHLFFITGSVTGSISYEMPLKARKNARLYWTPETSAAVNAFNSSTCQDDRNRIYESYIHQPMSKLVENVFNTFKFCYMDNGPEQAQHECLAHLVSNIGKFDPTKRNKAGNLANAFSYFSIIAKHHFIMVNNSNYNRQVKFESLDSPFADSGDDHYTHNVPEALTEEENAPYQYSNVVLIKFVVEYFEKKIPQMFKHQRDITIANSVIEVLRNHERIDTFNKKALYLYMREMSRHKTQQITKVIGRMSKYFRAIVDQYNNKGQVDFDDIVVPDIRPEDKVLPDVSTGKKEQLNVGGKKRVTIKSEFFRECNGCKHIQYYATRGSYNTATRKNSKCPKCQRKSPA